MTPQQFEREVLPLKDRLFRYAFSYLGQAADAQDVVQDVLLKAWETLCKPNQVRNIEAWCMAATKNRALDKLKKHGRHYEVVEEQTHLPSSEADPHRLTVARDAMACFKQFLQTLPGPQREAIHLRDVEQYSYLEIADLMQVSISQVKTLLHRGRQRIKEHMTKTQHYGTYQP